MEPDREPKLPYYVEKAASVEPGDEERTLTFVASDETVDRYGDVINADGWQLAEFRKNPVFLWLHSYAAPIGKVEKVHVDGSRLLARVKFASEGVSALADDLWKLVKERILRAVSVGFMVESPDDYELIRNAEEEVTGVRYLRQQLLELSLVSVPANPNALAVARSLDLPNDLIRRALPLDASVQKRQFEIRRRVHAARLAALRYSAPR